MEVWKMIIKVRGKLYDSKEESIGILFSRDEMKMISHQLIEKYPAVSMLIRNESRDDNSYEDMCKKRKESESFYNDVKDKYPEDEYIFKDVPCKKTFKKDLEVV